MRIFSVAHVLLFYKLCIESAGKFTVAIYFAKVVCNGPVVLCGMFKGFYGQLKTACITQLLFVFAQFLENSFVIRGINNHTNMLVVFRRCPEHGRAANINILNGGSQVAVRSGNGFLKGVEINHHQVYRGNVVLLHNSIIGATSGKDAAMNFRMQCFNPPIHHLRKAGVIGNFRNCDTLVIQ